MSSRCAWLLGLASWTFLSLASAAGQTFEVIHEFRHSGENPTTPVLAASDGNLYVTTFGGGDLRKGSVQKLTPNGTGGYDRSLLHSFDGPNGEGPESGLIEGPDGMLYGLTLVGGIGNGGVAYKISTAGEFTLLHEFVGPEGFLPRAELVYAADGNFYGTSVAGGKNDGGAIFRMNASGDIEAVHSFAGVDGANPQAALVVGPDGLLYGNAQQGGADNLGTLYRIDLAGNFELLHEFAAADGVFPTGPVAFVGGSLYGTAWNLFATGSLYRVDALGNFATIYVFSPSGPDGAGPKSGLTAGADGFLYGTTQFGGPQPNSPGTVFRADADGNVTTLHGFASVGEGYGPQARPTFAGSDLVGTTTFGGPKFDGTVYRVQDDTFAVLSAFGTGDGQNPVDVLEEATEGVLYGATNLGGDGLGEGTLFRLTTAGTLTSLHSFDGLEGRLPGSGLKQAPDGNLYGTTSWGGTDNLGTAFRLDLQGAFTLLHTFFFADGGNPFGKFAVGPDDLLYGTAFDYGSCGNGNVYRMDIGGFVSEVYGFCSGVGGAQPFDRLVTGPNGDFYGVTATGRTVFELSTDGDFRVVSSASGPNAFTPSAGVTFGSDGNLYGGTDTGVNSRGAISRLRLDGRALLLHAFPQGIGTLQKSALLLASDGNFFGTTTTDSTPVVDDQIFRINRWGDFVSVHDFDGSDGAVPTGLIQASDGNLYGTTARGGLDNVGVAYRLVMGVQAAEVTPGSGPATDAVPFTLTGRLFQQGADVSFGGVAAAGVVVTDSGLLSGSTPVLFPGTLNDVVVTNPDTSFGTLLHGWLADFLDVPADDPFHPAIETLVRFHIAAGYGTGFYGRDDPVTRAQIAPLILKSSIGPGYAPTFCDPFRFADVDCASPFSTWITDLAGRGITAGCQTDPDLYCPDGTVTRAQAAVFLLKALHGTSYTPPVCEGLFADVVCPGGFAVEWIEEFYREGITAGCETNPLRFCPEAPVSRGELAVLLGRAFGL